MPVHPMPTLPHWACKVTCPLCSPSASCCCAVLLQGRLAEDDQEKVLPVGVDGGMGSSFGMLEAALAV